MNTLLRALVALVVGVVVAFIVSKVCLHFGVDEFWGFIAGCIAGLAWFLRGPEV